MHGLLIFHEDNFYKSNISEAPEKERKEVERTSMSRQEMRFSGPSKWRDCIMTKLLLMQEIRNKRNKFLSRIYAKTYFQ